MNMTITALLLIVGINILVWAIQLLIFVKTARAANELQDMTAEYLKKITEISLESFSEAGIRVNNLLEALETVLKR